MLSTVLDKLGGLFSKRFMLACWSPVFVAGGAAVLLSVWVGGAQAWIEAWNRSDPVAQVWIGVGALLAVTVVAYLFDGLQGLTVRTYEGYWPDWPPASWLKGLGRKAQRWRWRHLRPEQRYGLFPPYRDRPADEDRLMPTALGNVLRSAEAAPYTMYRIDAVIWWPRLAMVVPEGMRAGIQQSLTPLLALLNMTTLSGLFGLIGGALVARYDPRRWLAWAVLGGGLALAWLTYAGAVRQAVEYGHVVRTAFDLYRHDLLEALNLPLPKDLTEEWQLWLGLNDWLGVRHRPPWETWQALTSPAQRSTIPTTLRYAHRGKSESTK